MRDEESIKKELAEYYKDLYQPDSENLFVGGGFHNFPTNCSAPAVCKNCSTFLVKNYFKKNNKCPKCKSNIIFYNGPENRYSYP